MAGVDLNICLAQSGPGALGGERLLGGRSSPTATPLSSFRLHSQGLEHTWDCDLVDRALALEGGGEAPTAFLVIPQRDSGMGSCLEEYL